LYFLLQSCSGHSSSTGEIAHGEATLLGFLDADADDGAVAVLVAALVVVEGFPLNGGLSSFDFRLFSGRGTEKVVGDVDGVFVIAVFVDMLTLVDEEFREARPLLPPFLNLLCTELRVSVKFSKSLLVTLLRPLLARPPFGNLESSSSVGESQNLGGAQSCFVQSINVPTYVFPLHVTLTAKTPPSVSCHTIPSKVTDVPGSHGPKQSGSVMVPIDVPMQTSTMSFEGSHFVFFIGGDETFVSSFVVCIIELLTFERDFEKSVNVIVSFGCFDALTCEFYGK